MKVGQKLVLKVTSSYCVELHKRLEKQNLTPKLYHYEIIGGWLMIFMEDLRDHSFATISGYLNEKQFKILEKAVEDIHNEDWVHGDLREPNILISANNQDIIKLIDFDWSGKVGKVHYPTYLNPKVDWPKGVVSGALIQKEHDMWWLEKLKIKN